MNDKINRHWPIGTLNLEGMTKLAQDVRIIGNFIATVGGQWFSFNFQVFAMKSLEVRDVGNTARKMLTIGKELALRCKQRGTAEKIAVFSHRFSAFTFGRLIPQLSLTVHQKLQIQLLQSWKSRPRMFRES